MKLIEHVKGLIGNPLAKATSGTAGLKLAFTGLLFVTSLVLARYLGVAGYGVFAYAIAWLNLLTVFALLGLDKLLVREVSVYKEQGQWRALRGILQWAPLVVLSMSMVLGAIIVIAAWVFASGESNTVSISLSVIMLALPLAALGRVRQAIMQGLNHIVIGQLPENIIQPAAFLILVIVLWTLFGSESANALVVLGMYIAAIIVAFLIGGIQLYKRIPGPVKVVSPVYFNNEWLRSAMPMLLVGGMNIINARIDTIFLGAIKGVEAAGIYVVAARGAELILFVMVAVNTTVAPTFAHLYATNKLERLQKVVSNSARIMLLAATPVAAALILFGGWFLGLFGPEFIVGQPALTILCVGQLINVAMGSPGVLLVMTGNERQAAIGVGVCTALNLILNSILIPVWGVAGAATATAISIASSNVLLAFLVHSRIGIHSTAATSLIRRI